MSVKSTINNCTLIFGVYSYPKCNNNELFQPVFFYHYHGFMLLIYVTIIIFLKLTHQKNTLLISKHVSEVIYFL